MHWSTGLLCFGHNHASSTCWRGWEGTYIHECCDNVISKVKLKWKKEVRQDEIHTQKNPTPYKNKSLENCRPSPYFLKSKCRKPPYFIQSSHKCKPKPHSLLKFTLQYHTNWSWWQCKNWHQSSRPDGSGDISSNVQTTIHRAPEQQQQSSFAKISTPEPYVYSIFPCLFTDGRGEVRAAWGTQMGGGYNRHKLSAWI